MADAFAPTYTVSMALQFSQGTLDKMSQLQQDGTVVKTYIDNDTFEDLIRSNRITNLEAQDERNTTCDVQLTAGTHTFRLNGFYLNSSENEYSFYVNATQDAQSINIYITIPEEGHISL